MKVNIMNTKPTLASIILFFALFVLNPMFAQQETPYFQQEVNTNINVTLDDKKHQLTGEIEMEYKNNSPETLNEIYIHLWANAYKDRTTAFAKQQIRTKSTKFYFAKEEDRGNFENLSFTINDMNVSFSYFEENQDIAIIKLPMGLKPGEMMVIKTPFVLNIPASFSRLGHVGTSYQLTQWFPKPAVYDRDGWHPMPYLNMGEFYSEFGRYDVSITLPENYVIASTGVVQNESERQFLARKIEETKQNAQDTIFDTSYPESSTTMKTVRYTAENVHDFGWFADKRFYVEKGNVTLSNGDNIDTWVFYTDTEKKMWQDALSYVDRSVAFYSEKVGNYPYPQATAVQSALSAGGGMEYPMCTVIGKMGNPHSLDGVITHEVGHNWFYGILGFNERDHPWLDEGINSYYDHRYDQKYYDKPASMGLPPQITNKLESSGMHTMLIGQINRGHDQAPSLHSDEFESMNYFFSCYEKPAVAFEFLEQYLGAEEFDRIMQKLYTDWEFKHPGPQDVIRHFNQESGQDLSWFFDGFIYSTDEVNYKINSIKKNGENYAIKISNKGDINAPFPVTAYKNGSAVETKWYEASQNSSTVNFPFGDYDYFVIDSSYTMLDVNMENNYKKTKGISLPKIGFGTMIDNSKRKQLYVLPALGYNMSDGFMLGLNLHNMSFPLPRFKGSINTMYGFNSKEVVGMARLQYDQPVKKGKLQRISYKLLGKRFSTQIDDDISENYQAIIPSVKLYFIHGQGSSWTSALQLKSAFISNYSSQSLTSGSINNYTEINFLSGTTNPITPIKYGAGIEYMSYNDVLQKHQSTIKIDGHIAQGYQFMKNKLITARAYAAFFPVRPDVGNTTNNGNNGGSNNNINLVYNSFADHTHDDYFMGRNRQTGFGASQIKLKEGAFKLGNIDAGSIGQSDLAAFSINLISDIPIKKFPNYFKLYFDYGMYGITRTSSEGNLWETIYSGGVMFNFKNIVNVYFPLVNSNNIKAVQGGKYISQVTFTLDLDKVDVINLYNNARL